MLESLYSFLEKLTSLKMDAAHGVILGALITGLIALVTAFFTSLLNVRTERKKWLREQKEQAYRECLDLLYVSRRWPENNCLGKEDYNGAMSSVSIVPLSLAIAASYSGLESQRTIMEHYKGLFEAVSRQKKLEKRVGGDGKVALDEGLFPAIENALLTVQECARVEILKERGFCQKVFVAFRLW